MRWREIPESVGQVAAALVFYAHDYDFADAMHLASSDTTGAIYSFDERFVRKSRNAAPPGKMVVVPGK